MKIPYYHIKEEVKRIDRHNEKVSKRIESKLQNENHAAAKEMVDMGNSQGFRKDVKWNKKHPGYLEKTMRKIYG